MGIMKKTLYSLAKRMHDTLTEMDEIAALILDTEDTLRIGEKNQELIRNIRWEITTLTMNLFILGDNADDKK